MIQSSVKILFCNDNADSIVASAGRISTTKGSADEIYAKSCERDMSENNALIQKIIASGHTSVLEHVFFNLSFNNVSVFVEQFIIEFRLASFTVKSRRYVDFGKMGYVFPEMESYHENADAIKEIYQNHMNYLFEEYNDMLDKGIPKEDARFVLPYSFRSNFYCTVNARELVKIVSEMIWGRGSRYPEIVLLGESILEQCKNTVPFLKFSEEKYEEDIFENIILDQNDKDELTDISEEPVVLLDSTESPEEVICRAAMMKVGIENWNQISVKNTNLQKQILKKILCNSRKRELEQANFTILFQNVSLAGVTHLVRHRMQSIVIPEYISACDYSKYIVPDSVVSAGLSEKYTSVFKRTEDVVNQLKEKGLKECDQVYLLLSGLTIPIITTMNANELFTFIRLRSCNRAQWEIADDAKQLLKILRQKHPILFSLYGPACYATGKCPEGKMTCGQMDKIKEMFDSNKY